MNNDREKAVEKFTLALVDVMDRQENATIEFKRAAFETACAQAANLLSKEELVSILMFVINDHDVFFDIFEQTVSKRNVQK